MSNIESTDEVKQELLDKLGPTLGPTFHALYEEVTSLHMKWGEFKKLYAHSPQEIDLLNQIAPFFFRVVQDIMWDDIVLHIARLADPAVSVGKSNLALRSLPPLIPDRCLAAKVDRLVQDALSKSEFARQLRNRRLAHRDLDLVLDRKAQSLPRGTRKQVEDALAAVGSVMNAVYSHYLKSTVAFDYFITAQDAETLLYHLKVASQVEERRRKGEEPLWQ